MQQIFERESRREKNIELMKKNANDSKGAPKKKGDPDPEQIEKEKEAALKDQINYIQENFFKHVATEEHDADAIKARGELNQKAAEESAAAQQQ